MIADTHSHQCDRGSPPVVSVQMPVYNAERYVGAAIDSILRQTFTDFELIVVDDGSTDGSLAILRKYEALDQRVRVTSQPNAGVGAARNAAMELARGEFLAVMDADDLSLPGRLAAQVQYLRDHSGCVGVGCAVVFMDEDGDALRDWPLLESHDDIDREHMAGRGGAIIHSAFMMRREVALAVGKYRTDLPAAEDLDLFLRLAEVGKLVNLPEVLVHYRQHLGSLCYADREGIDRSAGEILEYAFQRRGLGTMPTDFVPPGEHVSEAATRLKWAWWALSDGNVRTARKHAFSALRSTPFSPQSWRAAYCALRGH